MKKLLFVLMALLIATPAMALTLTEGAKDSTSATVGYNSAGGAFPRAFGLVIQATGGTITSVTPAMRGESGKASAQNPTAAKGFGIFPGTIRINEDGTVADFNTPVEPNALPGGPSLIGTSRVVVALGSLYAGDANKPAASGSLFTVGVSAGTASITISEEETSRGGVVDVNALGLTVAPLTITLGPPPVPAAPTGVAATDGTGTTTITVTWTASAGATSYDVYKGFKSDGSDRALAGNIAASPYNFSAGATQTAAHGETTYFWVKAKNANGDSVWSNSDAGYITEFMKATTTPAAMRTDWVNWGRPDCWGYRKHCNGDINGAASFSKRVTQIDLDVMVACFNDTDAQIASYVNSGIPGICADLNHAASFGKRVTQTDLDKVVLYYNDADTTVPECAMTNYNFWKN